MNKKGISQIVVTILMIVLVLIAVGVIWSMIAGMLEEGASEVGVTSQCLKLNVVATKMTCDATECDVTLNRKDGGDEIGGVKLIFSNTNSKNIGTTVEDVSGEIPQLGTKVAKDKLHGLTDEVPDAVEIAIYILSESGKEQLCAQTRLFRF